jgi:hypothetical protein
VLRLVGCRTIERPVASGRRADKELIRLSGHPLTQLIVVIVGCAAISAVFGLLKALRGPVGMIAYASLMLTIYAYYRMGDRYFTQGIWEIAVACLIVMRFTLARVPFLRVVLAIALIEFGSRITKTAYPHQTLLALGITAAMIAVATFWSGKSPAAPAIPSPRATYRRGPGLFDPYTGQRLQQQRSSWLTRAVQRTRARRRPRQTR